MLPQAVSAQEYASRVRRCQFLRATLHKLLAGDRFAPTAQSRLSFSDAARQALECARNAGGMRWDCSGECQALMRPDCTKKPPDGPECARVPGFSASRGVTTIPGVVKFTRRIQEWNCWYHVLNCGFPLKVSGETDFPCMSSRSVGQGRVYVDLGKQDRLAFAEWCAGLGAGRSYVSDGYAHALQFEVNGKKPGSGDVALAQPAKVPVRAKVAFAPRIPRAIAYGNQAAAAGRRIVGDTRARLCDDSGCFARHQTTQQPARALTVVASWQISP